MFSIEGTKSLDSNAVEFVDLGVNFVGRTFEQNGIQGKIARQHFAPNAPNTITATVIGNYKYAKFQREEYYCSQNINKLTPKEKIKKMWCEEIAYFMISCVQKFVSQYDGQHGGYKLEDIRNHKVFLPVDGTGQIDFDFILEFSQLIKNACLNELEGDIRYRCDGNLDLTERESRALKALQEQKLCWKNYKIGDLFYKVTVNKLPYKAKDLTTDVSEDNSLPCLTSSFRNQGLQYYCPQSGATILQNVISIPSNSDVYRAYFQTKKFTVLSDAYAVDWIANDTKLTHSQYLFMVSCINKVTDLPIYSYKNKLGGWNVVKEKCIVLPTIEKGIDLQLLDDLITAIKKIFLKKIYLYVRRK